MPIYGKMRGIFSWKVDKHVNISLQSIRGVMGSHLQEFLVKHAQIHVQHESSKFDGLLNRIAKLETEIERLQKNRRKLPIKTLEVRNSLLLTRRHLCYELLQQPETSRINSHFDQTPESCTALCTGVETYIRAHVAPTAKQSELGHSRDRCLSKSHDHELRLQKLESAMYDEILLWKIDKFRQRRREAIDGENISTPFYTSHHGYKMCVKAYLNGDEMGKGNYLSIFFVIMQGPFDAHLTWSLKQNVMLTLLNKVGVKHVTEHFHRDSEPYSVSLPVSAGLMTSCGDIQAYCDTHQIWMYNVT